MLELAFVVSEHQNRFFRDLVDAFCHELGLLGIPTIVSVGDVPPENDDRVFVLVPPHEYFALEGGVARIERFPLGRTVFVCAEQPGTHFFEDNVRLAARAGAVFDINPRAVREFARHGIHSRHLRLGYSSFWDHRSEGDDRDVDVLFLGCASERRLRYLAHYAESLSRRTSRIILSDNSHPNWEDSPGFLTGNSKWRLLARSKVLINIHQGSAPYFEWLRVVEAMANGCAIVTEHSTDYEPLVPGRHFLSGRPETLHLLAQTLLDDDERRRRMEEDAEQLLRSERPLAAAVSELAAAAAEVAECAPVAAAPRRPVKRDDREAPWRIAYQPADTSDSHDMSVLRRGVKDVLLELRELRRHVDRYASQVQAGGDLPPVICLRSSAAYPAPRPRVSILISLYNYAERIEAALDSIARSRYRALEVVVVDDASTDDSAKRVEGWIQRHDHVPVVLLRHPVNRGLPNARNTALDFARGEFCFILDADNEIYPRCITVLVEALDDDPGAAFAFGMVARVGQDGPQDLVSHFPWEPARLRAGNYIDAMALIRTVVLRDAGGYTDDPRLYGLEDYDLWCELAERGLRGLLVPEIVGRYSMSAHSMIGAAGLSTTVAFSVLAERYPRLMSGLRIPM